MWKGDNFTLRLQGDVRNLNNRLNLIDFAGLFSETRWIRHAAMRFVQTSFQLQSLAGKYLRENRHRGTGRPASPATPPYMRVRIRRLGGLS
jgi:hypothetical protein